MLDKDQFLLERAYLTLSKAISPKRSLGDLDEEPSEDSNEREEIVSSGPLKEPAPGVDIEMVSDDEPADDTVFMSGEEEVSPCEEINDDDNASLADILSSQTQTPHASEEEHEEDEMALDNLNSIRESINKIARFCSVGGHLETWQQQKLAIAMDNLAGVARSVRI